MTLVGVHKKRRLSRTGHRHWEGERKFIGSTKHGVGAAGMSAPGGSVHYQLRYLMLCDGVGAVQKRSDRRKGPGVGTVAVRDLRAGARREARPGFPTCIRSLSNTKNKNDSFLFSDISPMIASATRAPG